MTQLARMHLDYEDTLWDEVSGGDNDVTLEVGKIFLERLSSLCPRDKKSVLDEIQATRFMVCIFARHCHRDMVTLKISGAFARFFDPCQP